MSQLNLFKWRGHSKKKYDNKSNLEKNQTNSNKNELDVNGLKIHLLRRAYQRSIKVSVKPNGSVRVTSGKTTSINEIQQFLLENEKWLKKALRSFKDLRTRHPRKQLLQGESFLFKGEYCSLSFVPNGKIEHLSFEVDPNKKKLNCLIPKKQWNDSFLTSSQPQIRSHLIKFYERQGQTLLEERVQYFSEAMGLIPTAVSFRSQKTRWGSCSPDGSISLNWRLIAAPPETLDYVVIHELAHLQHMNHSSNFWKLVESHCPNCKQKRKWLRDHQYEFDFLAKVSEIHPLSE